MATAIVGDAQVMFSLAIAVEEPQRGLPSSQSHVFKPGDRDRRRNRFLVSFTAV